MLRSIVELKGYTVHATDGDIGKVSDFYFDDKEWTVRYLIVDMGNWLVGRRVLIAPAAFQRTDWDAHAVDVKLTREQVKQSPDVDTAKPITRQHEREFAQYYGWPMYWGAPGGVVGGGMAGTPLMPIVPLPAEAPASEKTDAEREAEEIESHLRSANEVLGYHLRARDGEIGHISDFLLEDETWKIQYLVVNTANWLAGRKVLVSPSWVTQVGWPEREVSIDLKRETIANSPPYDADSMLRRAA